jgi:hypothetical protein
MTKTLERRFAELSSQDGRGFDAIVPARYFHPLSNWTWYPTEYDSGDRIFLGYVCGFEDE